MKIGFITIQSLSFSGGVEVVSRGIVSALQARGHDVHTYSIRELNFSSAFQTARKIASRTPYSSLLDSWKMAQTINKEKFDAVISNDFYGFYVKAPKKICFMHGYFGDVFRSTRHRISPLYYRWGMELARLQRMAAARADVTVVPSAHSGKCFEKDGVQINHVIPNGIDSNQFTPTKSSLSIPPHYLVHVASQAQWKNFDMIRTLSESYKIECVSKPVPHVSENIHFLQNLSNDELAGLYTQADAMVHPAFHEGFGLVACEAMACETPAVITNTGYGPDIAVEFPELVVQDPSNQKEFKEKIDHAIANKKELGKKCRQFIVKNNDYKEWQKKWVKVVEE